MNKLKTTFTGGMPDFLDNFRWHEAGVNEALAHIVTSMANSATALKLYGAHIYTNGPNYIIAAGAIFFDGEIFTVPEHALLKLPTGETGTYYWEFEETFDPEGLLQFEDENLPPQDCYAIRVAKLKKTSEILEPGTYVKMNVDRFTDVFTTKSVFNVLQNNHINLSQAFTQLRAEVGAAYFYASFQNESNVYFDMPWISAFGQLHSETADLKIVNGGVYEINVVKWSNGSSLRLYRSNGISPDGLNLDYELYPGVNVFHLNGYAGVHDVYLQGKYIDGTTEVLVRLVSVDPNPSIAGGGGVVVNPG